VTDTSCVNYQVQSISVDFAAAIDTVEDELCERFDLTEEQAKQIAEWHFDELESNKDYASSKTLQLIAGGLLEKGNIKIKTLGLIFAGGFNLLNGWKSERDAARMTGFTVAAINQAKDYWVQLLGIPRQNSKSQEACSKYRENGLSNHWRRKKRLTL
jgi:hypothetical protein